MTIGSVGPTCYQRVQYRRRFCRHHHLEPDRVRAKVKTELKEGAAFLLTSREIDGGEDDVLAVSQSKSRVRTGANFLLYVGLEELAPLIAPCCHFG
jgi:hypothetical protein